jgi:uncharacterized protein YbjT (DUF2867 family)
LHVDLGGAWSRRSNDPRMRLVARVLVAGAGGALGREVVPLLAERGHDVIALVNRSPAPPGARAARIDLLRPVGLEAALDGVDTVFSAAGASVGTSLRDRAGFDRVDVPANRALIDAARAKGVRRFVYVSIASHEALGRTKYVRAHEEVVAHLRGSGMQHAIVRATGFFSALTVFLDLVRLRVVPNIGGGRTRTNPIHERDLADVCVRAIEDGEGEIGAGGPEEFTRRELLELAARCSGVRIALVPAPAWAIRFAAALLSPLHPRIAQFTEFAASLADGDTLAPKHGSRRLEDYFAAHVARAKT